MTVAEIQREMADVKARALRIKEVMPGMYHQLVMRFHALEREQDAVLRDERMRNEREMSADMARAMIAELVRHQRQTIPLQGDER